MFLNRNKAISFFLFNDKISGILLEIKYNRSKGLSNVFKSLLTAWSVAN